MPPLTATTFEQLLFRLDTDRTRAAEKYEALRQKLVKCLTWKGCPETEADTLADTTLDRVANKIAQGENIENLDAYACQVLRFVWLEFIRKRKEDAAGDDLPDTAVKPDIEILQDPDMRLRCLRKCMAEVIPDETDKTLIIGYYDTEAEEKNKDNRKDLAEKLGLTMNTLKVKAYRLRERLEKCINNCVAKLSVTKTSVFDTNRQGGDPK